MAARNWTDEQRQQQAERIRRWSPWSKSTGPRSPDGKAKSSRNGWRGGMRNMLRALAAELRKQRGYVRCSAELASFRMTKKPLRQLKALTPDQALP